MNIDTKELVKILLNQEKEIKSLDLENALLLFLNNVKQYNREATMQYYISLFKPVLKHFNTLKINNTSQINKNVLKEYIKLRSLDNVKPITINKEITGIKSFMNFLIKNEYIDYINLSVPKLKVIENKIETISNTDITKILNYSKNLDITSQAMIYLLFTTGIRTTELIYIKNSNIDFMNNRIFLERTKTHNTRYIFFDETTKQILLKLYNQNNIYLFTSYKTNEQLKPSAVRSVFKRLKKKLNIETLSPHKCRHTFATSLIRNNVDLETTRLLLGHTTYETTKKYLHLVDSEIQNKSLKYNPINSLNSRPID